jgi:hypothetical protein
MPTNPENPITPSSGSEKTECATLGEGVVID